MVLQEGSSDSTLDSRGRFILPTTILRNIPAECDGRFVINRGSEKYLALYTINEWNRIKEGISTLNTFKPEMRRVVRYFMGSAAEVKLDAKNRILIPPSLVDYACLEKDLQIVTSNTSIEIWNPRLYDIEMNDPNIAKSDAYDEFAETVFNKWKNT